MKIKELLGIREKIKSKKPHFLRRNNKIKLRLSKNWRRPKGLHNKMRLNKKGYAKPLRHGYGSPSEVKYLDHKTGLMPIIVHNKNELLSLNTEKEIALISSTVGTKKKLELIKIAQEKNIRVLQDLENIKLRIKKKQEDKKKLQKQIQERKKIKEKKKKKQEEKKKKEEVKSDETITGTENVHDKVETQKAKESEKMNKEILQKRV